MSSSKPHRRVVLLGLAALAGCGFTPAYAPGGPGAKLTGAVLVEAPNDRDSFNLVKQLELRLGQPSPARYSLDFNLIVSSDGVGKTSENETTRYNLVGRATFILSDIETDQVLSTGSVDSFTGYSVGAVDTSVDPPNTSSTISTRAAEQNAHDRLMVILADQIVTRLLATSGSWPK